MQVRSEYLSLECNALACGYGAQTVLEEVSFQLVAGENLVLLGPNGSGKSTLLKTLLRLLPLHSGHVLLDGKPLQSYSHHELAKKMAYVPQTEDAPFDFTARQVVFMGRTVFAKGLFESKQDHEAAEAAMAATRCLELADHPLSKLSAGERQRVLIARALAQEAKLVILDEPTAHLDIASQIGILQLLRELAEKGHSFLIALHDLNLAALFGAQAMLLFEKKPVYLGPVQELLNSDQLERVYRVEFIRHQLEERGTWVFPRCLAKRFI